MLRHCFLFILAVSLFLGCVAIGIHDEDVIEKCGGKEYTSANQICENNVLKIPCGNNFYVPSTQFCYENNVIEKCGGKNYNPANQKCENDIVKLQCGSRDDYYYPSTQFCSEQDTKIYDKCGTSIYNTATHGCQDGVVSLKCGNEFYNSATQFCYENNVIDKCQGKNYDAASQKCENDILKTQCGTGSDYYDPSKQFCDGNDVGDKCSGKNYNLATQFCFEMKIYDKCDNKNYNLTTQFCSKQDAKVYDKCNGEDYNTRTYSCDGDKGGLYFYFTDDRDNQEYKAVVIGSQTWMAENLNYYDGISGSICYNSDPDHCEKFGRLYLWMKAMDIDSEFMLEKWGGSDKKRKGICPGGWHLPSDEEWEILVNYAGGKNIAGTKLKAAGYLDGNWYGTDDYGFAALPGGYASSALSDIGKIGIWWSATQYNDYAVYSWSMNYLNHDSDSYGAIVQYPVGKILFNSVRCIKD